MGSSVKIHVAGLIAVVPDTLADRDDAEEAVEALLKAALPHYNEGVRSLEAKRIPEALRAIRSAVRLCPYCTQFVDFGLALAIQHGDFELARQLIVLVKETEMDAELPRHDEALEGAVSDWNRFLNDTTALRKKYQSADSSPSYRELLLLANRAGAELEKPLSELEKSCLSEYGIRHEDTRQAATSLSEEQAPSWRRQVAVVGVTGLLGLIVGLGVYNTYISDGVSNTRIESLTAEVDSLRDRTGRINSTLRRIGRANRLLARGTPLAANEAWETTKDTSDTKGIVAAKKSVRSTIDHRLYAAAVSAWEVEDFREVVNLLTNIHSDTVGTERERLYMLGVSATQTGESEIAIKNLQALLKIEELGERYPHYEAQAVYALVQLLSGSEAQRYANLIAEKYSDTLYYNSTVRSYL